METQYPSPLSNMPHRRRGIFCYLPWIVLVLICALLLMFGCFGYPVPDGDAAYYWPPMLSRAEGRGMVNDFSKLIPQFDRLHHHRMVYHGYLYPLTVGLLAWSPDYTVIHIIVSLLMVFSLIIGTLLFLHMAGGWKSIGIVDAILVSAAIPAMGTILLGLSGRAEALAMPVVTFGALMYVSKDRRWHSMVLGVALGLLAGTHPIGCILAGCMAGIAIYTRISGNTAHQTLLTTVIISLFVWVVPFQFYPYSLHDWLHGLAINGRNVSVSLTGGNASILYRWFVQTNSTCYGFIVIAFAGFLIVQFVQFRGRMRIFKPTWQAGCFSIPIAGAIYNYGIRNPVQNYNLLMFFPLVIAYIVWRSTTGGKLHGARFTKIKIAVIVVFLAGGAGFFRTVMIFPYFMNSCLSRTDARRQLAVLHEKYPGTFGLTSGLFTITNSYSDTDEVEIGLPRDGTVRLVRSVGMHWNQFDLESPGQETLLLQQVYRDYEHPPKIAGYRLIENGFTDVRPGFLGLKLKSRFGGYNFAVYRLEKRNFSP